MFWPFILCKTRSQLVLCLLFIGGVFFYSTYGKPNMQKVANLSDAMHDIYKAADNILWRSEKNPGMGPYKQTCFSYCQCEYQRSTEIIWTCNY
mmetsp:Transcript_1182/g.1764  ORF Transcript_1182/g.1764 Transcript_1182/m.1764 type:complete len:93 (-) Transcript_1182:1069-1347(-)